MKKNINKIEDLDWNDEYLYENALEIIELTSNISPKVTIRRTVSQEVLHVKLMVLESLFRFTYSRLFRRE